jgi:hypothetical protein
MPQPMPTPTALGTMAPFIGITLPIVQPFLGGASGIAATFAPIDPAARTKVECWHRLLARSARLGPHSCHDVAFGPLIWLMSAWKGARSIQLSFR